MRLASRSIMQTTCALAIVSIGASAICAFPAQVFASPLTSFQDASADTTKDPVLLQADTVDYDQPGNMVVATGKVEVTQGQNIIIADQVRYDLANNRVYAFGNVSMLQPSGDVFFANEVELQDDLREGVIRQFGARLADNSLFVANGAKKVDENRIELYKASYTPCNCDEDGVPLWQLSADRVELNKEEQEVTYDNAYFKVLDTPVLYTPYFSHATPGADNKSGLLMPSFMRSQNLGTVLQTPIYYSIAPDKDVTITPIFQSIAGNVLSGQYRQAFDNGGLLFEGSVTQADKRDAFGSRIAGNEIRGHYKAQGTFHFADYYNAGFDLRRASDDTYLRLYNFSNDILLTSRAYVEGINFVPGYDRTYASVEGLAFQGLTGQDDRSVIPMILPLANITHQTNPGYWNSRFRFDGNLMALTREDGNESRRLSGSAMWKLPYISEGGQMIEFTASMRSDVYHVNNVLLSGGQDFDGFEARQVPQATLSWRYPFINYFEGGSVVLEPIVEAYYSPNGNNSSKIPNEDSRFAELTDGNIFSANRFAGLDRVETGLRTSYGLRAFAQVLEDKYIDALFGQSWRENDDRTFPYAQDLTSQSSDYVGKIGITSYPFSLSYRFRLDSDNFSSRRSEVNGSVNYYPVGVSLAYLSIQDDPILQTKEIISASSSINLTRNWSWLTNSAFDVLDDQINAAYTGVNYADECTNLTFMAGKDYTNLQDIRPATTFWVQVSLRNLE